MASSFADRAKLLQTESFGSLPPALQAQFAQLEELVAKCLCAATELGNVVIITNAEAGWVEVRVHFSMLLLFTSTRALTCVSFFSPTFGGAPPPHLTPLLSTSK